MSCAEEGVKTLNRFMHLPKENAQGRFAYLQGVFLILINKEGLVYYCQKMVYYIDRLKI